MRLRARALEPVGRLLTWACTWPRRLQWKGGASRSPRPLAAQPPRGSVAALADSFTPLAQPAAPTWPRAVCACARSGFGGGRKTVARPRPRALLEGGGRGRPGRPGWGRGRYNSEKEGSGCHGLHTLTFWGCQRKVRKDCSRFPHFMSKCKSLEPSLTPSCHEPQQFLQSSTPFSNDHL